MTSSWSEYLCLFDGPKNKRLFTGRYEALALAAEYFDEKSGEYHLPESIDGKIVHDVEDDYVVGGDLCYFDDDDVVEFTDVHDVRVRQWLHESQWEEWIEWHRVVDAVRPSQGD